MAEKRELVNWIKEHRMELIAAGISITAILALIVATKKRGALIELVGSVKKAAGVPTPNIALLPTAELPSAGVARTTGLVFHHQHIRQLPHGQHASPSKAATALQKGIQLLDGQTWVKDYFTGSAA